MVPTNAKQQIEDYFDFGGIVLSSSSSSGYKQQNVADGSNDHSFNSQS